MRSRKLLILYLSICLQAPFVPNPNGPPWINPINGGLTVETGCTCHGDGVPSNDVVVSISGVPRAYALGESYEFTINLQHASYDNGGFLLSDYGSGTFTAGEGHKLLPTPMALNQEQYHKRLQATIGLSPGLHHQRMSGMFPFHLLERSRWYERSK